MVELSKNGAIALVRSCTACIRAKRRCDRLLPRCTRCASINKECLYVNEPLAPSSLVQGLPQAQAVDDRDRSAEVQELGESKREDLTEDERAIVEWRVKYVGATLKKNYQSMSASQRRKRLPIDSISYLEKATKAPRGEWKTLMCVHPSMKGIRTFHSLLTRAHTAAALRSYPELFCSTGKTPFIHPLLADMRQGAPAKDLFNAILENQLTVAKLGPDGGSLLMGKIYSLVRQRPLEGSFEHLVSAVQALLLALAAVLFSSQPIPVAEARKLLRTLLQWTQHLYTRVPTHMPSGLTPWAAWAYAESVRRTIILAHIIASVYDTMQTGAFISSAFLTALPFDGRPGLWESEEDPECWTLTPAMVSYKEFTEGWRTGRRELTGDGRSFEAVLTVRCCGYENVVEKYDAVSLDHILNT